MVVTVEVVVVVVVLVAVEVIVEVATESIPLLNAEDLLSLQKLRLRDILVEEELTRSPLLDQDTLLAVARSSFGCPFCRAPQVLWCRMYIHVCTKDNHST